MIFGLELMSLKLCLLVTEEIIYSIEQEQTHLFNLDDTKQYRSGHVIKGVWPSTYAGGSPLTQKSLTRFPLPLFWAYVRASGGFLR